MTAGIPLLALVLLVNLVAAVWALTSLVDDFDHPAWEVRLSVQVIMVAIGTTLGVLFAIAVALTRRRARASARRRG